MLVERAKSIARTLLVNSRADHAERVAKLLNNPTDEELAAAYLHDILEDTRLREEVLRTFIGDKVTDIVKELTNPPDIYNNSVRDFSHYIHASKEAKKIKMADRIDNIRKRLDRPINGFFEYTQDYIEESKLLLGYTQDGDEALAVILKNCIKELSDKCLDNA